MALSAVPVYLKEANEFVKTLHRHSIPTVGCRFALGAQDDTGKLVGVAICGRPVARLADNGRTLEVLRVCTDGTKNACSFLYTRCRNIAKEMGYKSVITYTLKTESGDSLRAVGATVVGDVVNGSSDWTNRPGRKKQAVVKEPKFKWELLNAEK